MADGEEAIFDARLWKGIAFTRNEAGNAKLRCESAIARSDGVVAITLTFDGKPPLAELSALAISWKGTSLVSTIVTDFDPRENLEIDIKRIRGKVSVSFREGTPRVIFSANVCELIKVCESRESPNH